MVFGPISLTATFRRRLRHGRYMMTKITTVRRKALLRAFPCNYGSMGPRNAYNQFVGPRNAYNQFVGPRNAYNQFVGPRNAYNQSVWPRNGVPRYFMHGHWDVLVVGWRVVHVLVRTKTTAAANSAIHHLMTMILRTTPQIITCQPFSSGVPRNWSVPWAPAKIFLNGWKNTVLTGNNKVTSNIVYSRATRSYFWFRLQWQCYTYTSVSIGVFSCTTK